MEQKRGLFVVFEGIDGAGTSTQLIKLVDYLESLDKYQDVLRTHEPWKSSEIKRKLVEDKDTYSNGLKMAELYVQDRLKHAHELIGPNLERGVLVLSDRYSMSTCAYQSTQGVDLEILIGMHRKDKILIPDITFFVDVSADVARERILARGNNLEKFEKDLEFSKKLVENYQKLSYSSKYIFPFGKVVRVNGEQNKEKVSSDIQREFLKVYENWKKN